MEENVTKNKKTFLPVLLVAIVLLAVGGYFAYKEFFSNNSPKEMFVSSIEKTLTEKSNFIDKKFNTLTDEFSISAKVSSPFIDKNLLNIINKLKVDGKLELDMKNNNIYVNLDSKYDGSDLIKLSAYLEDNAMYMMLDDVLNKWIKVDLEDGNSFDLKSLDIENLDIDKYSKVGDEVIEALKDSLKDEYFKKEKEDGKTKITLTIDNKNAKEIIVNLLKNLKKAKNFEDLYEEISGSKTFASDMDVIIDGLKDVEIPEFGKITASAYVNSKNELSKLDITAKIGDDEYSFILEQPSKDTIEFAVKVQGVKMLSGSFTSKEEKGKTTASMKLSVMEMFNIELNIEEKIKYDAKLTKVDVSDAVSGEDLTDKDLEKLEKLEESKGIKKLMEDLEKVDMSSLMSSFGGSSSMDF